MGGNLERAGKTYKSAIVIVPVIVIVIVGVAEPVIVDVHVNGNATVDVIDGCTGIDELVCTGTRSKFGFHRPLLNLSITPTGSR